MDGNMSQYVYNYFQYNFITLFLAVCFFVLSFAQRDKLSKQLTFLRLSAISIIVLTITNAVEAYYSDLDHITIARFILTDLKYLVPPICLYFFVLSINALNLKEKLLLALPLIVDAVVIIASHPFNLVYRIVQPNNFIGGPLHFFPFLAGFIYEALFIFFAHKKINHNSTESILLIICAALGFTATIIESTLDYKELLTGAMMTSCLVYYIYLTSNESKYDLLTGVYNRRAFYNDTRKKFRKIVALVSMDMNGLKFVNDNYGHAAGDVALKKLANAFLKATSSRASVYRVGGDEFMAIVYNSDKLMVLDYIDNMDKYVKEADLSCSFGYVMIEPNVTLDELIRRSDQMMYENKNHYYESLRIRKNNNEATKEN